MVRCAPLTQRTAYLEPDNACAGPPGTRATTTSGVKVAQHPQGLTLTVAPGGGAGWGRCEALNPHDGTILFFAANSGDHVLRLGIGGV
jgi:hypothetical protein